MINKKKSKEIRYWESKYAEAEEMLRIVGKALDLIPITVIGKGTRWIPSDEALQIVTLAKDRMTEWRLLQNGR